MMPFNVNVFRPSTSSLWYTARTGLGYLGILSILFLAEMYPGLSWGQTDTSGLSGSVIKSTTPLWAQPGHWTPDGTQTNHPPEPEAPTPAPTIRDETLSQPTDPQSSVDKLRFSRIVLEGNTLLDSAHVEALIAPYQNRPITFAQAAELAEQLSQLYAQAGYTTCNVYIPEQAVEDGGLLRLQSQEVAIDTITLERNNRWFGPRSIKPYLSAQPGDVLNTRQLQRNLLLLNQNPDRVINATLKPGSEPNTTHVVLESVQNAPIHLTPFWDNLGRRSIGHNRFGATVTHNNLLGFGDTASVTGNLTEASEGLYAQYQIPLNAQGTKLGFSYAYSHTRPQGSFEALELVSSANVYSVFVEHPLLLNERRNLWVGVAFDWKNLTSDEFGDRATEDRIRMLRPYWRASFQDSWGRTLLNQEMGIGLDMWGGTQGDSPSNNEVQATKAGSGTQFFSLNGSATRVQRLPLSTVGLFRASYQWSADRLLVTEQMQMGGAFTVRGYKEGLYLGDRGVVLNAEWYLPSWFFPSGWKTPWNQQPLRQALQWVAFADAGHIVTHRPRASELTNESLLGVGIGARLNLSDRLVGRVDLAFPLLRPTPDQNRMRIHLGVQAPLF